MASEIDPHAITQQIVNEALRAVGTIQAQAEETSKALNRATEEHKDMARRIDSTLEDRAQSHVRTLVAVSEQIEQRLVNAAERVAAGLQQQISELRSSTESALSVTAEANASIERATVLQESADKRVQEAEQKEAEAKRSIAVTERYADLMVRRALADRDANIERKEIIARLKSEEESRTDQFEREEAELKRSMNAYWVELDEKIEKIIADNQGSRANEDDDDVEHE